MVRDVLVKVRKDQQEFEHPVSLLRVWLARAHFEILDDRQGIGKQPFQAFRVAGNSTMAAVERLIGPLESFIQKMIQAKLFAGERRRDRSRTRGLNANS
jgi:hypothetical protein